MKQKLISGVTLTVLLVLVALPLLFIVLQAIFPHFSAGSLSGALTGVPMLFADPQLLPMLGGTLWVACGVALMSVVIGLPLGVLRGLFNVPLPRLWDLLFLIPFDSCHIVPAVICSFGNRYRFRLTLVSENGTVFASARFFSLSAGDNFRKLVLKVPSTYPSRSM